MRTKEELESAAWRMDSCFGLGFEDVFGSFFYFLKAIQADTSRY